MWIHLSAGARLWAPRPGGYHGQAARAPGGSYIMRVEEGMGGATSRVKPRPGVEAGGEAKAILT
jgi:hypothetical protein